MSDHPPPAVIAAADQMAAGYNDMIARFPKMQGTFKATFDRDAYERIVKTLPMRADFVGGPLDGLSWTVGPGEPFPEMLAVQVGSVTHWHQRVTCDWWTCYEWLADWERP